MKQALLFVSLALLIGAYSFAGEDSSNTASSKKLPPDERKRRFEQLKKELEAFKPAADAEREEVLAYLQQVFTASTKFAKDNPQTAEGFEAASTGALQLANRSHPKSGELAQLALDVAPQAGVEMKQIAICWLLVGNAKLTAGDVKGAREAIDKMKPISPELHAMALKQLEEFEKKAGEAKKEPK